MWYVKVNGIEVASYYSRFDAHTWVVAMLQASRDRYACGTSGTGPCGKGTCGPQTGPGRCRDWYSYTRQIEAAYGTADRGVPIAVGLANQTGTAVTVDQYPATGIGNVACLRDYVNSVGHIIDAGIVITGISTHFDTYPGDNRPLVAASVRFLCGHPCADIADDETVTVPIESLRDVPR